MIFENGEAIVNLNEDVEKVKADQTVSIYDYATLVITFKRFLIISSNIAKKLGQFTILFIVKHSVWSMSLILSKDYKLS